MKSLNLAALFVVSLFISETLSAKVWRINGNAGVSRDFSEVSTAVNSATVQNGDTLYVEGWATQYLGFTVNKRLTFIGTGYFLTENTGLQANLNEANISSVLLDSLGSGSTFLGLRVSYVGTNSNTDNITFSRCNLPNITSSQAFANSKMSGWIVNKCYVGSFALISSYVLENLQVTNCIFANSVNLPGIINGLIRNNLFTNVTSVANSYVANNIFAGTSPATLTNCTIRNNIAQTNMLPAGSGNQNNVSQASLFVLTGSTDGKYQLKSGSPAIGAGETVAGVTPDCGPFGTPDPYRLSGIPPIPTIYSLSVPASVPASATNMAITVSTRSNN